MDKSIETKLPPIHHLSEEDRLLILACLDAAFADDAVARHPLFKASVGEFMDRVCTAFGYVSTTR